MSHYTCTVALPGHIDSVDGLRAALDYVMSPFNENMAVEPYECDCGDPEHPMTTYNPDSKWDWWVVGGRWGGYWTLKPDACPSDVGLETESSSFGMTEDAGKEITTDSARVRAIAAESLTQTFAYIDLDGGWHEQGEMGWFGMSRNDKPEVEWMTEYLSWIEALPKDTWVVCCDLHI